MTVQFMSRVKDFQKKEDTREYAYKFYISRGYTPEQSAGIVGNLLRESNLNPIIPGTADDKGSMGIAQWHSGRLNKLKKMYGDNWIKLDNQLDFVDWELKNTHKEAGIALKNSKGVWKAGQVISDLYEKPKNKFSVDEKRQQHVADTYIKFKGTQLSQEDKVLFSTKSVYDRDVAPYIKSEKINLHNPNYISNIVPQGEYSVPDVYEEPKEESEPQQAQQETVEAPTDYFKKLQEYYNNSTLQQEEPTAKKEEQEFVTPTDVFQIYNEISQFVDNPVAQEGRVVKKPFVLQDERNLVQRDNTPNTKRDLSLMMAEYNNAKKDKEELTTTGQIKNPRSIQYRRNVKPQAEVRQDNISTEQRNAQLSPLERPLIYLANPSKVLGDLGVPNMETSELDRQAIVANRFNPNQSRTDRFLNQVKLGVGYVPEATLNVGMAAAFMPEGTGALGLVNEAINPLAGTGEVVKNAYNFGKEVIKNPIEFIKEAGNEIDKKVIYPIQYNKEIKEYKKYVNSQIQDLDNIETRRKLEAIGVDPDSFLQDFKNTDIKSIPHIGGSFIIHKSNNFGRPMLNIDFRQLDRLSKNGYSLGYKEAADHEIGHIMQGADKTKEGLDALYNHRQIDVITKPTEKDITSRAMPTKLDLRAAGLANSVEKSLPTKASNSRYKFLYNNGKIPYTIGDLNERLPMLRETKREMVEKEIIENLNSEVTPENIEQLSNSITGNRILDFLPKDKGVGVLSPYNRLANLLSDTPAIAPIVGASYLATQGQDEPKKFQQGGTNITQDNNGYYNPQNWGQPVEINSNNITMDNVKEPLWAISDTGELRLLQPNKNYTFKGATSVTEYPLLTEEERTFLNGMKNYKNK